MARDPLHPIEAERALLGAILLTANVPDGLDLEPAHFGSTNHGKTWRAIQELRREGTPVDLVTVSHKLRGKVPASTLASLLNEVPCIDAAHVRHYASAVRRAALYRQSVVTLQKAVRDLKSAGRPPVDVWTEVAAAAEFAARADNRAAPQTANLADLEGKVIPPPRWTFPGLVPEGTTNLAGRPKAGKSLAALDLALAVALGGKALGQLETVQGEVLYLALEISEGGLQELVRRYLEPEGTPWPASFHYATTWKPLDQGGMGELGAWLAERPRARLVVIDTLAKIRRHPPARGNAYVEDYAELGALQSLALKHQVAMLLVTHTSKRNLRDLEDPADAITGSTAITAVADVNLVLTRVDAGRASARLIASGRRIPRQDLALDFDPDTLAWTILADAQEYQTSDARHEIVELLREAETALSPREIAHALGKKEAAVKNLLKKLCREGVVEKPAYGSYCVEKRGDSGDSGDARDQSSSRQPLVRVDETEFRAAADGAAARVTGDAAGDSCGDSLKPCNGAGFPARVTGVTAICPRPNIRVEEAAVTPFQKPRREGVVATPAYGSSCVAKGGDSDDSGDSCDSSDRSESRQPSLLIDENEFQAATDRAGARVTGNSSGDSCGDSCGDSSKPCNDADFLARVTGVTANCREDLVAKPTYRSTCVAKGGDSDDSGDSCDSHHRSDSRQPSLFIDENGFPTATDRARARVTGGSSGDSCGDSSKSSNDAERPARVTRVTTNGPGAVLGTKEESL